MSWKKESMIRKRLVTLVLLFKITIRKLPSLC